MRNISSLPEGDNKVQSLSNLDEMVSYCLTPTCRKSQIVNYFDGKVSTTCNRKCDVCLQPPSEPIDGTQHAKSVIACLQSMKSIDNNVTIKSLALTYRGSKSKPIINKGYNNAINHGNGSKDFNGKVMYKFIHLLIANGLLKEKLRAVEDAKTTPLLVLGNNSSIIDEIDFRFVYYR